MAIKKSGYVVSNTIVSYYRKLLIASSIYGTAEDGIYLDLKDGDTIEHHQKVSWTKNQLSFTDDTGKQKCPILFWFNPMTGKSR